MGESLWKQKVVGRSSDGYTVRRSIYQILKVAQCFWGDAKVRSPAVLRLLVVFALQLLTARVSSTISELTRIQTATIGKGIPGKQLIMEVLRTMMVRVTVIALVQKPIEIIYSRVLYSLRLLWIEHLTSMLIKDYLSVLHGSQWKSANSTVKSDQAENIDQHIAEDVGKFVGLSLSLTLEVSQGLFHLYFYSRILYQTSASLSAQAIAASFLGTFFAGVVGRGLSELHRLERESEHYFRYCLTRIRENAESITFYGGGDFETQQLQKSLSEQQSNSWRRKIKKDQTEVLCALYQKLAANLPTLVLLQSQSVEGTGMGPEPGTISRHVTHGHSHDHSLHLEEQSSAELYTRGAERVSRILQATEAFNEILHHLLLIAENFNDFSKLRTVSQELFYLLDTASRNSSDKEKSTAVKHGIVVTDVMPSEADPWLVLDHVSLRCFSGEIEQEIVHDLSVRLLLNQRLLVTGPSGVGKTTLLRSIAGFWTNGSGSISKPPTSELMFIPQKPYLCLGSFRDQFLYPKKETATASQRQEIDIRVLEAIRGANLWHVYERLGNDLNRIEKWSEILSIGEQQRIAFGRAAYHRPQYIVLDEATSACDLQNEKRMYQLLETVSQAWVSVGHRRSIEAFHTHKLTIASATAYELEPL